ncbi:hypothetical protein KY330_05195 [Candidatus Woesearchaeota archaeon]|nr:hypothetical protein [Candidatus Woesearchaeota archaeon]
METVKAQKENLKKIVEELVKGLKEPLYRGLGSQAESDYRKEGRLKPYSGSISVGKGVFLTNNLDMALSFMDKTLVVTTREKLDPEKKAVDTRKPGYDKKAREKLGEKASGLEVWEEIQKEDTITFEGGPADSYVYTARKPLTKDQLLLEVAVV